MNQQQIKYARSRAEEILNVKLKEITNKYTIPAVTLSAADKIKALKEGKFTTRPVTNSNMWHYFVDFGETFASIDIEKRDPEHAELRQKFTKLLDELVLGDDKVAMQLLKEFEDIG